MREKHTLFDMCIHYSVVVVVLQFLKRQDLLNVLARMMRPVCDQVVGTHKLWCINIDWLQVASQMDVQNAVPLILTLHFTQQVKVTLNDDDMDTFVFAVGSRKAMARLQKEMQDLVSHKGFTYFIQNRILCTLMFKCLRSEMNNQYFYSVRMHYMDQKWQ